MNVRAICIRALCRTTYTRILLLILPFLALTLFSFVKPMLYGLTTPEAIGKFLNGVFPEEAPSTTSSWSAVEAYPNLTFTDPIQLLELPGTNKFLMAGKRGEIWTFDKNPSTHIKLLALDIKNRVRTGGDSGLMGVALHPEFGQAGSPNRGYLYVFYRYAIDQSVQTAYLRLSRFNMPDDSNVFDPAEHVLIQQYDRHDWHNGGGIFFGLDGFLYLSIGDEGGANDQYDNGQKIDEGLLAGVLRIDVDKDPARSHPIIRQPQNPAAPPSGWPNSFSQDYYIPNDNPWVNPAATNLEEFYAIGTRSPHRMTQDPATGDIWLGDVGQGSREEISLVPKGGNLQWPYKEGTIDGRKAKPNPLIGFDVPPVYDYDRGTGNCVIGGFVYRGTKWPSLQGKYLFADHTNRNVWSMDYDAITGNTQITTLVSIPAFGTGSKNGISSFATDASGEVYILKLYATNTDGGKIYKLIPNNPSPDPPKWLSQTGAFTDLANLSPAPGLIPYNVNAPLWTDGAAKKRWVAIPNNGSYDTPGEQVIFSPDSEWSFPEGTVFIKHFEMPLDENNPAIIKRLETRFLVRGKNNKVYGVTYMWNAAGTDAELLTGSESKPYTISHADGTQSNRIWTFPDRGQCINCHNDHAGGVLGVKTHQLNGNITYPSTGISDNQLRTWNHLGIFSTALNEADIPAYLRSDYIANASASAENRVRAYLDANCAHCHRPGSGINASFDARLSTPLESQELVEGALHGSYGMTDAAVVKARDHTRSILLKRDNSLGNDAMPPLGKNVIDETYIQVLEEWIGSLAPGCTPYPLPQNSIAVQATDSEETNGQASNAIDGNPNTIWHTEWMSTNPVHPHEIQLDLGEPYELTGLRYLPRQDASFNGTIKDYEIYVSQNGTDWGSAVASGSFAKDKTEKSVFFSGKYGQYIRLRALSEVNGNPWTSAAEINALVRSNDCNSPGGLAEGMKLWLKGNSGFQNGKWKDQSEAKHDFSLTTGNPQTVSSAINFHPAISFDKSDGDDLLTLDGNLDIRSFFIVYQHTSIGAWETPFTNNNGHGLFHGDDGSTPNVYNTTYTPPKSKSGNNYVNGTGVNLLNHSRPQQFELHSRMLTANENGNHTYFLGRDRGHNGRGVTGQIAEIIAFNAALNTPDREKWNLTWG